MKNEMSCVVSTDLFSVIAIQPGNQIKKLKNLSLPSLSDRNTPPQIFLENDPAVWGSGMHDRFSTAFFLSSVNKINQ